jgi:hypothetical protein
VYFHLFSGMCPAKHVSPKTSGTRLKYMHVSKFVYFSCFWTIIGGSKYAIVTANKSSKLNLCSFRTNG